MTNLTVTSLSEEKANSMAIYFENNIPTTELAYWLSLANSYCSAFPNPSKTEGQGSDSVAFLNSIGMFLLPELIGCTSKKQRIQLLKNELVSVFDTGDYEGSKQALSDIGVSFMKSFVKYIDAGNDVSNFMAIYNHFLILAGVYKEYCYLKDEEYKNKIAA